MDQLSEDFENAQMEEAIEEACEAIENNEIEEDIIIRKEGRIIKATETELEEEKEQNKDKNKKRKEKRIEYKIKKLKKDLKETEEELLVERYLTPDPTLKIDNTEINLYIMNKKKNIENDIEQNKYYWKTEIQRWIEQSEDNLLFDFNLSGRIKMEDYIIQQMNQWFGYVTNSKDNIVMRYLESNKSSYNLTFKSTPSFLDLLSCYKVKTLDREQYENLIEYFRKQTSNKDIKPLVKMDKDGLPAYPRMITKSIGKIWIESKKKKQFIKVIFNPKPLHW